IGQALGMLAGIATVLICRALLGLEPLWAEEAVWVIGAIFSGVGFMLGVGALDDWIKWMRGIPTPFHHGPPPGKPAWVRYFSVDYNHKIIGIQYGVTAIIMLMIGGGFAVIFRTELARSGLQFLQPD